MKTDQKIRLLVGSETFSFEEAWQNARFVGEDQFCLVIEPQCEPVSFDFFIFHEQMISVIYQINIPGAQEIFFKKRALLEEITDLLSYTGLHLIKNQKIRFQFHFKARHLIAFVNCFGCLTTYITEPAMPVQPRTPRAAFKKLIWFFSCESKDS